MAMVFYATFNNSSVIWRRLISLVEETEVPGEYHRPVASHWQTLSHILESSTSRLSGFQTHNVSGDRHNFEMGPPKDHPSHILLNLVQWFQRKRFKCESLRHTMDGQKSFKKKDHDIWHRKFMSWHWTVTKMCVHFRHMARCTRYVSFIQLVLWA